MQRTQESFSNYWRVLSGSNIPVTLYGRLRRSLRTIYIVTPFLEDYEFFGKGPLSRLLLRQIAEGVDITMLTMPPEGKNGTKKAFSRKYKLMNMLYTQGVKVLFIWLVRNKRWGNVGMWELKHWGSRIKSEIRNPTINLIVDLGEVKRKER